MALDVLIGILLFISAIVNILALGAFWITPSLRTTSNRFVINLLIANLASCIILAPSFLMNAAANGDDTDDGHVTINNSHLILKTTEINETIKCFNNNSNSNNIDNSNNISNGCISNISNIKIIKNYSSSDSNSDSVITKHITEIKCWGLDLAAALGSLSVLLVVGDTWCAVTDPLRYHTRISSLKAWILIVSMWIISAVFGFGSAFRNQKFTMSNDGYDMQNELIADVQNDGQNEIINQTIRDTIVLGHFTITQNLYTTIYSYLFFIIIILLPFMVVCAMYWRIFSEARGNGLRMRQNGSSPLLQSALNLAANQHNNNNNTSSNNNNNNNNSIDKQQPQQTPTHYTGLTLKIDNNYNSLEKPPIRLDIIKATELNQNNNSSNYNNNNNNHNNNILLTVTTDTPTIMKSANSIEYIRRNHSARQLFLLESTNNIKNCGESIRHVHSTPNLQKLMFSDTTHHHHHGHHHHHSTNGYGNHSQGNTLTSNLQVPPKALSYMTSIRHRLSNASSLFKYREESRAARISILVVIMFLVSYLPYGILILIQGHVNFITSYQSAIIAILTVLLANLSSPFIFAYRNKRVCRGVKHLLGLEKKSNQNNNIFRGGRNNTYKTTVSKVKRNCSKASTYSQASSNRYLTPQSALKGTFVLEIEKCTDDEDSSYEEKKSFLKRICDTSRKWDCTTDSCSGKIDNEQTEV